MLKPRTAKFQIGQMVKHRVYPFRGVIFDVDPVFDNTEEWYQSIPEDVRPHKEQPFYHLFAENEDTDYIAYVSEQNLVPDDSGQPVGLRNDDLRVASEVIAVELALEQLCRPAHAAEGILHFVRQTSKNFF